jgi:hypothetical protein
MHVIEGKNENNGVWMRLEDEGKPLVFGTEDEAVNFLEKLFKKVKSKNNQTKEEKENKPKPPKTNSNSNKKKKRKRKLAKASKTKNRRNK